MSNESFGQKTAKSALWTSIEKFSSLGVSFIVSLVLARMLTPSDYGTIALLNVFFALANTITNCGFGNALIRKDNCTNEDLSTAFLYNITVSVVLYIILFFASPIIASFYENQILCKVMRVSGVSLIIGSANIVQVSLLTRELNFKKIALINFLASLISGISGIILAYLGFGIWALVAQGIINNFFVTFLCFFFVEWRFKLKFSRDSFRYLWSFGSNMLIINVIATLYENIYSLVIGKFYNASSLGLFNRGQSLASFIPNIVNSIFTKISLPLLAPLKNNRNSLLSSYRKLIQLVAFFNFPLCLIIVVLSKPLILLMLTEKWEGAIIFLQIFGMAFILTPLNDINIYMFQVEGRTDIALKLELIKKSIAFTTVAVLMLTSPMILAIGSALYNIAAYLITLYFVSKMEEITIVKQIKDVMPILVSSISAALIASCSNFLDVPYFVQIILGGVIGLASYLVLVSNVFKSDISPIIFENIRKYIQNHIK